MKKISITLVLYCFAITSVYTQVGRVGINTTVPRAALHVRDSSILFTGPLTLPVEPGAVPVSGIGNRTMWYANKAAFRTGGVSGSHWDRDSIGNFSFAAGNNTMAKGLGSMAFGNETKAIGDASFTAGGLTKASGHYATAFGFGNMASGHYATASGILNKATGNAATALGHTAVAGGAASLASGYNLVANGYCSTVIGLNNDSIVSPQNGVVPETPLFIIGNGADTSLRKNAVVVRYDGRVGIGTNTPVARLHVRDSSVVFSGIYSLPYPPAAAPVNGPGSRMMWYADMAAFRAGTVNGPHWDTDSIGFSSMASGFQTVASGHSSTAFGINTRAVGYTAFTAGGINTALGDYSVALGHNTKAMDFASFTSGWKTEARKDEAMALNTKTIADGNSATSMGYYTIANAPASLSVGAYNDPIVNPTDGYEMNPSNPLFIVGNGEAGNRTNALVLYKNGKMGLGTNQPMSRLHVHETATDKEVAKFSTAGSGFSEIVVANENSSIGLGALGVNGYVGTKTPGHLYLRSNAINQMVISTNGNVGIGDLTPGFRLEVKTPETDAIVGNFQSGGGAGVIAVGNGANLLHLGMTNEMGYINTISNKDFGILTHSDFQLVAKAATKRIGIGLTDPLTKLHVFDNQTQSVIAHFQNTGGYGEIDVSNGTATVDFGVSSNDGYLGTKTNSDLFFRTNAVARMKIGTNGHVGIGTLNPGSLLEVNGTASKPGGGSWTAASDARLKTNVSSYTDGLSKVLTIHPVSFQYNVQSGFDITQTHVGVIAQELQEISPYMVTTSDKVMADGTSGYLQVDNSAMVYMLINAIKEQQEMINVLQERIALLEGE